MLNGLDLFSGIGGITCALAPWVRPIAYCENDRYAQAVLLSRMRSGELPIAPIWDDVRTITKSDLPDKIDIIVGGFPCQDISIAGRRAGLAGERSSLYWELHRLVDECRPAFVFLENVPGIRTKGLKEVVGSLADIGYDCRWTCISAADVGAPHLRKRWFLLAANTHGIELRDEQIKERECENSTIVGSDGPDGPLADVTDTAPVYGETVIGRESNGNHAGFENVAHPASCGHPRRGDGSGAKPHGQKQGPDIGGDGEIVANASGVRIRSGLCKGTSIENRDVSSDRSWWNVEPDVGRVADGIPAWLDRSDLTNCVEEMRKYGIQSMENPAKAVRFLRENDGTPKIFQRGIGISNDVCPPSVLFSFLRRCETLYSQKYPSQKGSKISRNRMRGMPDKKEAASTSHRSESRKQQSCEHPNALLNLSQFLAQDCATRWAKDRGAYASDRVDRLRGLGNGVVPRQARTAYKILRGIQ